jgi:hypothetical protein
MSLKKIKHRVNKYLHDVKNRQCIGLGIMIGAVSNHAWDALFLSILLFALHEYIYQEGLEKAYGNRVYGLLIGTIISTIILLISELSCLK